MFLPGVRVDGDVVRVVRRDLPVEDGPHLVFVEQAPQLATTKVARQLPSRFVKTRIESIRRSAPSSRATAATGNAPIAAAVADGATNAEPGTPG